MSACAAHTFQRLPPPSGWIRRGLGAFHGCSPTINQRSKPRTALGCTAGGRCASWTSSQPAGSLSDSHCVRSRGGPLVVDAIDRAQEMWLRWSETTRRLCAACGLRRLWTGRLRLDARLLACPARTHRGPRSAGRRRLACSRANGPMSSGRGARCGLRHRPHRLGRAGLALCATQFWTVTGRSSPPVGRCPCASGG